MLLSTLPILILFQLELIYKKLITLFVEIFARTNFRASALRENWKFSRVLIFAHLYIFEF